MKNILKRLLLCLLIVPFAFMFSACSKEGLSAYELAVKKVEASQLAYNGIAAKFAKGLVTAIELQSASATLLQAQSDSLRCRLQYVVEAHMVDYYSGRPFVTDK